ncbi:hypothetical protein [Pseudofrankia asymbiotica]|uniref:hypothetical protein n=1 Tax=Pseudofrankia asymbiotica TaxID=1834516 RepID=UPI001054597E|nr:hypothetical protein [Pseudofrankia asymbiotica]
MTSFIVPSNSLTTSGRIRRRRPGARQERPHALVRELAGQDIPTVAARFPCLRFGHLLLGEQRRAFNFTG